MKKPSRSKIIFSVVLLLIGTSASIFWNHTSALMAMRWFVRETGIPVEIRSAHWDIHLREILEGKIRLLDFQIYYQPLKSLISIKTPVSYKHSKKHWYIYLEPELQINSLPPAKGTIKLEFDTKKKGKEAYAEGVSLEFKLESAQSLKINEKNITLSLGSWKLSGTLGQNKNKNGKWDSQFKFFADQPKLVEKNNDFENYLSTPSIKILGALEWMDRLPLPFGAQLTIDTEKITALYNGVFPTEQTLHSNLTFDFDGENFSHVDISVDKPLPLKLFGNFKNDTLEAAFHFRAPLEEIVDRRLSPWFEPYYEIASGANAKGTLDIRGKFEKSAQNQWKTHGDIKLKADSLEIPLKNTAFEKVELNLPFSFPDEPDWGNIKVKTVNFHSIPLKNIYLSTLLSTQGVDLTTEGDSEKDYPIRQSVWGGHITVSDLYAHFGGKTEFTATLEGGPFQISEIQKDLCLIPDSPIDGTVKFSYPKIIQDQDSLHLIGSTDAMIFNGKANVGDLHLFFENPPRLRFTAKWEDFDLQSLGKWTKLGDMRGSLDGAFSNASLALTSFGPIPLSYEFVIQGRPRAGNKMRFYGRAVDSLLELMGSVREGMPWYANWALTMSTSFRNLLPATVEYLGFKAKADGDWTELSTFDPPVDGQDAKKHYILFGTAFTIPLNTHGVYPVLMKTDAFQGWLWGMAQYFKGRMNNEQLQGKQHEPTKSSCKPLF